MTQQQGQATVGDTVTIIHRIMAPPGAVVQARGPADSTIATLVGAPTITREGDSVRIAYTVAVWAPGRNDLVLPGPVIIAMNGRVDTLADAHVVLDVASLLPTGQSLTKVMPRPAHPWVPRADQTVMPLAILLPFALVVIALLQWRWRRRGRPVMSAGLPTRPLVTRERLERWLAAGEARLALEHLEWQTREREDLAEWRGRVAAVRFAPSSESELAILVNEGCQRAGLEVS
jgi:hypothetical protein